MRSILFTVFILAALPALADGRAELAAAWPKTALHKAAFDLTALDVKGPRNAVPPLNTPSFVPLSYAQHVGQLAPVIEVTLNGKTKIYPLHIVASHAIINDELAGVPIAVTYCRVCASPMVFKRQVDGEVTRLGFTGVGYEDNLVLFDEATETWWQQINGLGLAGPHADAALEVIPSGLKSLQHARDDAGQAALVLAHSDYSRGRVLPPINTDAPGTDPIYVNLSATEGVVVVDNHAYRVRDIAARGEVVDGDLVLRHRPGRHAGPDAFRGITDSDIGTIDVLRRADGGARLSPEAYRFNLGHALDNVVRRGRIELRDFEPINDPYAPERRVIRDK
ncbi:MAG: DUF3179 domain-containing (seleno)protein [Rhodothalassiaceae bacterium]